MQQPPTHPGPPVRVVVTARDVAARLEVRFLPGEDPRLLAARCALAAREQVAAVLVPPELVASAARSLAGTGVPVATTVAFHDPDAPDLQVSELVDDVERAGDAGAGEIGVVMHPGGATGAELSAAMARVTTVADAARRRRLRLRVLVEPGDVTAEVLTTWCRAVAELDVHLVQGGTWAGRRAGFEQVKVMRRALPDVLLKWTHPVRTLNMMLLCMAEGVDRFNGDAEAIIGEARQRSLVAPLAVPVPGHDY